MYAVASLFEFEANEDIKILWTLLDATCKLNGIFSTPMPHMSWFGSENLDESAVTQVIEHILSKTGPFEVQCSGLGVFTGVKPIVYLALIKSEKLLKLHKFIWESLYCHLEMPFELYSPENWIPHITLAYGDVDNENIKCAISSIAALAMPKKFLIDNISVIFNKNENIGILQQVKLKG